MNQRRKLLAATTLGIAALGAGALVGVKGIRQSKPDLARLPDIELPDIDRQVRSGSEWLGKVVVLNHWATWCAPCREEIPMLVEFNKDMNSRGVQVIGVAHDLLDSARIFGDQVGLDYPSLVAIVGGNELLKAQGNAQSGALPFTVVFDRNGNIARSKLGIVSYPELSSMVIPLLG